MYKIILAGLFALMLGSVMTGCYVDPFYDGGYRSGHHSNGGHERERNHGNKHRGHDRGRD